MPDVIGCLFVILDGHFHPRVTRFEKKKFSIGYFRPRVYEIFNWIFECGFLVCPWTVYGTIWCFPGTTHEFLPVARHVTIFTANDKLEARRKTYWYPSAHPIEFLEFTSKFQQFTLGTLNYNNSVHLQQLQSSYKLRQLQSRLKAFGQPSYNISHQMLKYLEDLPHFNFQLNLH